MANEIEWALMNYLTQDPNAEQPLAYPLAPFGSGQAWSGMFAGPEDEDEWGTLDYQNDRLTAGKKALDVQTDPAFITALTAAGSPGGWEPTAFTPDVSFEPVQAPGYQRIKYLTQSGDPVSKYIAERMADPAAPATASQVVAELQKIKNQGQGDPEAEAIIDALPQKFDDFGNPIDGPGGVDWNSVSSIANNLEKDIIADPTFSAFDPKTGLPANIVDPRTGMPSDQYRWNPETNMLEMRVERPTEAMEYFDRAGLPYPGPYDPSSFRTPAEEMQENKKAQQYAESGPGLQDASMQYAAMREFLGQVPGAPSPELYSSIMSTPDRESPKPIEVSRQEAATEGVGGANPFTTPNNLSGLRGTGALPDAEPRNKGVFDAAAALEDEGLQSYIRWLNSPTADMDALRSDDTKKSQIAGALGRTQEAARRVTGRSKTPFGEIGKAISMDTPELRAVQRAYGEALRGRGYAIGGAHQNFADNRRRQQLSQMLASAGHTPLQDAMRARQQNIYGFPV